MWGRGIFSWNHSWSKEALGDLILVYKLVVKGKQPVMSLWKICLVSFCAPSLSRRNSRARKHPTVRLRSSTILKGQRLQDSGFARYISISNLVRIQFEKNDGSFMSVVSAIELNVQIWWFQGVPELTKSRTRFRCVLWTAEYVFCRGGIEVHAGHPASWITNKTELTSFQLYLGRKLSSSK